MCYSNLNPSLILYHSSYHVISARGCSGHPGTVRHISNKCLTMRDLTPEPSIAYNYVLVAATGKYTCPWILCYPYVLLALIMFDTFLSLPSEIKYIWCQKPRLGSILYTLACYSTLATSLFDLYVPLFVTSFQVCENKGFHLWHLCSLEYASSMVLLFSGEKGNSHWWRKCNTLGHLTDAITILALIGVQGEKLRYSSRKMKLLNDCSRSSACKSLCYIQPESSNRGSSWGHDALWHHN